MIITVLTDNIGEGDLKGEWGLSLHIGFGGKSFLLDTGASDIYLSNAEKLGINLADVDYAVLSHAHYDHTNGLASFLSVNKNAPVFLSPNARDNCYAGIRIAGRYIGMPKGVVEANQKRFERPQGVGTICEGSFVVPHSTEGLERLGKRNHLLVRKGIWNVPDDFSHEQTLVFKTDKGLVLMNSCSHSGPDVIVAEALKAFPGEHVTAYVGGLHLFRLSEKEVESVADRMQSCGIDRIFTGHCTGEKAFGILKRRFGCGIEQFRCGMKIEI